jgi:hypothetical protein
MIELKSVHNTHFDVDVRVIIKYNESHPFIQLFFFKKKKTKLNYISLEGRYYWNCLTVSMAKSCIIPNLTLVMSTLNQFVKFKSLG